MKFFSNLTTNRSAWLLLAISAFTIELCALFFQYVMDLKPCIMCVYQRLAIAAIFTAGLIGFLACKSTIVRLVAYALACTGSLWGLIIAIEHVDMQNNTGSLFFSCEFIPNFPSWAPLHEWIPFLFEATGDCAKISWTFLSYSMPQWMVAIYALYSAVLIFLVLNRLLFAKKI